MLRPVAILKAVHEQASHYEQFECMHVQPNRNGPLSDRLAAHHSLNALAIQAGKRGSSKRIFLRESSKWILQEDLPRHCQEQRVNLEKLI